MTLIQIFFIIFVHWVADFVCQTDSMAQGKSKFWEPLLSHTGTYTLIWGLCLIFYTIAVFTQNENNVNSAGKWWLFLLITFIAHTATDYYTSRVNSKLWEEKKVHDFFVSIGFDQCLHYLQLFICFKLLILP